MNKHYTINELMEMPDAEFNKAFEGASKRKEQLDLALFECDPEGDQ